MLLSVCDDFTLFRCHGDQNGGNCSLLGVVVQDDKWIPLLQHCTSMLEFMVTAVHSECTTVHAKLPKDNHQCANIMHVCIIIVTAVHLECAIVHAYVTQRYSHQSANIIMVLFIIIVRGTALSGSISSPGKK